MSLTKFTDDQTLLPTGVTTQQTYSYMYAGLHMCEHICKVLKLFGMSVYDIATYMYASLRKRVHWVPMHLAIFVKGI